MKLIYPEKFELIDENNKKKYIITSRTKLKMFDYKQNRKEEPNWIYFNRGIIIFMNGKYMGEYSGKNNNKCYSKCNYSSCN